MKSLGHLPDADVLTPRTLPAGHTPLPPHPQTYLMVTDAAISLEAQSLCR